MLLGVLGHGCCRGFLRDLRCGVPSGSNGLGHPLACNVVRIDVRRRANNETTFKQCKNAATKRKISQRESKNANLQVRAPVRCGEPPPGPTGQCLRPRLYNARRLDVRCRRVTGHLTSGGRCNVRMAVRPLDQRRRGLLLLVVVIGDPDKPTALWRLAALCRQRCRRGGVRCHWPFPRHSVLGGQGRVVLLFLTAGVPSTPSSVVLWRVFTRGILHARCQ